jgi:hypothetical protein
VVDESNYFRHGVPMSEFDLKMKCGGLNTQVEVLWAQLLGILFFTSLNSDAQDPLAEQRILGLKGLRSALFTDSKALAEGTHCEKNRDSDFIAPVGG